MLSSSLHSGHVTAFDGLLQNEFNEIRDWNNDPGNRKEASLSRNASAPSARRGQSSISSKCLVKQKDDIIFVTEL